MLAIEYSLKEINQVVQEINRLAQEFHCSAPLTTCRNSRTGEISFQIVAQLV